MKISLLEFAVRVCIMNIDRYSAIIVSYHITLITLSIILAIRVIDPHAQSNLLVLFLSFYLSLSMYLIQNLSTSLCLIYFDAVRPSVRPSYFTLYVRLPDSQTPRLPDSQTPRQRPGLIQPNPTPLIHPKQSPFNPQFSSIPSKAPPSNFCL